MSNLARRLKSVEKVRAKQRADDPQWRSPQAWTRRFLDADPAHAAIVARISARPTSVHMCRHPDGHTHLGHFLFGLVHEATYETDEHGKMTAFAMEGLPNQLEAVELLGELSRLSKAYQARTGDLFPIPFWGV